TRTPGLFAPVVQRRCADAFLLGQGRDRSIVRRQKLPEDCFSALIGILHGTSTFAPIVGSDSNSGEVPTSLTVGGCPGPSTRSGRWTFFTTSLPTAEVSGCSTCWMITTARVWAWRLIYRCPVPA